MWLFVSFLKTCVTFFGTLKKNHVFDSGDGNDEA